MKRYLRVVLPTAVLLLTGYLSLVSMACTGARSGQWYRGNTHAHSLWSDGDAAPEAVVQWYRDHGYDFLSLTDHDVLQRGERWYRVSEAGPLTPERLGDLRRTFGPQWIETRRDEEGERMRLKTLAELRERFEVPGAFLLIEGEEISDYCAGKPLHINVFNPVEHIPIQGGETIMETVERDLQAINEQAATTGRNLLAHINHTNWRWALTAEELASMQGTHLFEVYNGSTGCNNYGDETHPGMDEVWDIANTLRLTRLGLGPLYGVATDDTHNYFAVNPEVHHPGRGWIVVRTPVLETDAVLDAMRAGEFYASTGVELLDVQRGRNRYLVEMAVEDGVSYTTRFIGTRMRGDDPGEPGIVLHETTANPAVYRYDGDELYVRARVVSIRMQAHPAAGEEAPEQAWTQPVVLRNR